MIITLLSDFGYEDNYAAVTKGILLQQIPHANIIDLSHDVEPFHLLECSYLLKSSYSNFPDNTVHLSLFNILHENPAKILIAVKDNQFIISADNGLLPLSFDGTLDAIYKYGTVAKSYIEWMQLAAILIKDLGETGFDLKNLEAYQPLTSGTQFSAIESENAIECQVIHIDYYGNVIVNITKDKFEKIRQGRNFQIHIVRDVLNKISADYSDVTEPGKAVCLFNSAGFLEIAVNQGSASKLLGLKLHKDKMVYYQHIKIEFL
jgi:S-adenosyl-L-methionine hydrolase (adenosine-forming)